ncbi:MAG: ankyrin repeat domain-containing protein [Verrucomicrobiota bacterium]|nr:ankyrin repeat domain-containing protein [Verrucomicrobiota bacterium]
MRLSHFLIFPALFALAQGSMLLAQEEPEISIWEAAAKGDLDAVEAHIDAGTDLDSLSEAGETPLHYAVTKNQTEVVLILLDSGVETDIENSLEETALDIAIAGRKEDIIDLLLEAGAGLDTPAESIHFLTWLGDLLGVKLHIYAGTNIDQEDEYGNYPLLLAVELGHIEIVDLLIEHEVELETEDQHGFTALIISAEKNYPEILQLLLDSGAAIDAEDKAQRTALDWSIIMLSTEAEDILRENDAPSGAEKSFIAAIQTNSIDSVKILLDQGADVNEPAYTSKTPVHYASHSRNIEILKLLISNGADLEAKTESGVTPLGYAVGLNQPENCRILLQAGSDVDTLDSLQRTNLNLAAGLQHQEVTGILLEFDANPNTLDIWNYSSLDVAEEFGSEAIAELIREAGGINGPKISIHDAAGSRDNEKLDLHLFFGTDINLLNENNETPMDVAANNNAFEMLTFLQERTRLDFINDDDGNKLIRVVGPYGMGDLTPQLEFVLEVSDNFEDWEILESIDTDDGVGELEFNPQAIVQSRFYRVVINEIED